jgi:ABC-type transport system involved in multi-copper enzyme maturation permease subunit
MNRSRLNWPVIRLLVAKDWQLFQKQLAACVLGGIVALCLIGMATGWSFYLGSLLLIIMLVCTSCFSISNSLLVERKEHTLAFVMSLPVTPLDYYLSKLIGNLVTFLAPFLAMLAGTVLVILYTPLPDGLVVLSLLIFGHVLLAYAVSLSVAMAVESEGWNIFAMIGSMLLINPLIMLLGQIPAINDHVKADTIYFAPVAVAILLAQATLSVLVLAATGWVHCRKKSFY